MSISLWISVLDLLYILISPLYWNYVYGLSGYRISWILKFVSGLSIIGGIVVARRQQQWIALSIVMAANVALYFVTYRGSGAATYYQTGPGSSIYFLVNRVHGAAGKVLVLLGLTFMIFLLGYATFRVVRDFMKPRTASFPFGSPERDLDAASSE